jgi:type II secretory pathway pseudopilin PulG
MNDRGPRFKRNGQQGTTLIELSVVIGVLLLLVGVLFIGIKAWKDGANTAACIVNLASIQKAVRGYENLNGLVAGNPLTLATLSGAGFWATTPACPSGGTYSPMTSVPPIGTPYMTCSIVGHSPSSVTLLNW